MPTDLDDPQASWPHRLLGLATAWRSATRGRQADEILGEIWTLLNLSLQKYVRRHARGLGPLSTDDVRDVAADKASELLRRLDSREWDPTGSSATQLCAFLAIVARNGVVDLHRVHRREVPAHGAEPISPSSASRPGASPGAGSPEAALEAERYARAIVECASSLTERARRAWFLRVFLELEATDIARDAKVASTPAGVDAMLFRARAQVRACLEAKGLRVGPLPTGTFVRLWSMMQGRGSASRDEPPEGAA